MIFQTQVYYLFYINRKIINHCVLWSAAYAPPSLNLQNENSESTCKYVRKYFFWFFFFFVSTHKPKHAECDLTEPSIALPPQHKTKIYSNVHFVCFFFIINTAYLHFSRARNVENKYFYVGIHTNTFTIFLYNIL